MGRKVGPLLVDQHTSRSPIFVEPVAHPTEYHYADKDGNLTGLKMIPKVATKADFQTRISRLDHKNFKQGIPLVEKEHYRGSEAMEMDFTDKSGRNNKRVAGHMFLDTVQTGVIAPTAGTKLLPWIVNPNTLGGRLEQLADEYEEYQANHLKVIYKPMVPATEPGSFIMYYDGEVDQPLISSGTSEIVYAASHTEFDDFQVWNSYVLDINPQAVNLGYFDDDIEEFIETCQGLIIIEAGATLTASKSYGKLYLEYDFTFKAPAQDFVVTESSDILLTLTSTTYVTTAGNNIQWTLNSASAGTNTAQITSSNPAAKQIYLYGVVTNLTGTGLAYITNLTNGQQTAKVGDVFWFSVYGDSGNWSNGTMGLMACLTPSSLDNLSYGGSDVITAASQLRWFAGATLTGTVQLRCKAINLNPFGDNA